MPTATKPDVSQIVHAYAMSETDKAQLTKLLAQSYLLAKSQAYERTVAKTRHIARIKHPWQPGKQDASKAQAWAARQVEGIAETYQELLQHAVEEVLAQEERGIIDQAGKLVKGVKEWFSGFLPWKTKQIADYTWNTGEYDGVQEWIDDVQEDDTEWEGDDPSVQDLSKFQITVVPGESSNDVCAQYAGNSYPIESADEIPNFPIHPSCRHSIEISIAS